MCWLHSRVKKPQFPYSWGMELHLTNGVKTTQCIIWHGGWTGVTVMPRRAYKPLRFTLLFFFKHSICCSCFLISSIKNANCSNENTKIAHQSTNVIRVKWRYYIYEFTMLGETMVTKPATPSLKYRMHFVEYFAVWTVTQIKFSILKLWSTFFDGPQNQFTKLSLPCIVLKYL